jgi:hypothetical protein
LVVVLVVLVLVVLVVAQTTVSWSTKCVSPLNRCSVSFAFSVTFVFLLAEKFYLTSYFRPS